MIKVYIILLMSCFCSYGYADNTKTLTTPPDVPISSSANGEVEKKQPVKKRFSLILDHIAVVKSSEAQDEVYLSVLSHKKNHRPNLVRIPRFPKYWISPVISQVKDVVVWEGKISEDSSINIMVSLLEQDLAPWDNDDLLGTIRYMFYIDPDSEKLMANWKIANQPEDSLTTNVANNLQQTFDLKGKNSEYKLTFSLKTNDTACCCASTNDN